MIGGSDSVAMDKKDITSVLRITKYEFPVIIGARTLQIDKGSKVFIHNAESYGDSYSIAMEEFKRDLIPFIIKRPINKDKGIYENIKISDLYHPLKYKK
jgi:DNA-directed RNA polymerase subunit K/omega